MANYDDKWTPLTSDTVLLNTLLLEMGLSSNVLLKDAYLVDDLDESTLALIIVYPESKDDEAAKAIEEEQRDHAEAKKLNVCLVKQTIDDACGMFAMINAVLNSNARKDIVSGSILDNIAKVGFEATEELKRVYHAAVGEGEGFDNDEDDQVEHHFTTLIELPIEDTYPHTQLVELDGERQSAFIRGTSEGRCLLDSEVVRKEFNRLTKSNDSENIVMAAMLKLVRV